MNLRAYLNSMGRWKWLNLFLVVVVPVAAYLYSWKPLFDPDCFGTTVFGPETLGAYSVVVGVTGGLPATDKEAITVRVRFCAGCFEKFKIAELALGSKEKPGPNGRTLSGDPNRLQATLPVPSSPRETHLWVSIETGAGERYRTSWPVTGLGEP